MITWHTERCNHSCNCILQRVNYDILKYIFLSFGSSIQIHLAQKSEGELSGEKQWDLNHVFSAWVGFALPGEGEYLIFLSCFIGIGLS